MVRNASSLIPLLPAAFRDGPSTLITGSIAVYQPVQCRLIAIDNWFGPRWLGFAGKALGAAGVHAFKDTPNAPITPFHPNRVIEEAALSADPNGLWRRVDASPLHTPRPSETNLRMLLRDHLPRNSLAAWCGRAPDGRWSLMVYALTQDVETRWYAGGSTTGTIDELSGLSRTELNFIEGAVHD